jgi:hypothetical protein
MNPLLKTIVGRWMLCVCLFLPALTRAADEPVIAVFDIVDKGSGLPTQTLLNFDDYLAVLLAQGGYQVIPREQWRERLSQTKAESLKPVYDQKSQIELGRELAANKTLASEILKIGQECRLTSTLIDLEQSVTEKASTVKLACNEEALGKAVEEIALKLSGAEPDHSPAATEPQPRGAAPASLSPQAGAMPERDFQVRKDKARLLVKLPPSLRQVMILKRVKKLTVPQISMKIGVPPREVQKRLKLARAELKRITRSDPSFSSLKNWDD